MRGHTVGKCVYDSPLVIVLCGASLFHVSPPFAEASAAVMANNWSSASSRRGQRIGRQPHVRASSSALPYLTAGLI